MREAAPVAVWSAEPLPADVRMALAHVAASDDVVRVAVMPDVHLAADVCVGAVVATTHLLYPSAVGGDIGCGMAAVRLDVARASVDRAGVAGRILAGLARAVPIMAHKAPRPLPEALLARLSATSLESLARRQAGRQLGTLGRGNHFLEIQVDDDDGLWLTVHSGSRAMGQAVRDHHVARGERSRSGLRFIDAETDAGRAYLADLAWALSFAAANRRAILDAAASVLADVAGAARVDESLLSCAHNHVERVAGLWVHRKGAIAANEGQRGIIPGSMGGATFHVAGRGNAGALWSSSHGAGRAMSRSEARRRIRPAALERDLRGVWIDRRKLDRLVDEAPAAYKDIGKVMRAQRELTRIVRRLRPLVSLKGV